MWLSTNSGPFELHRIKVEVGLKSPISVLHISDLHFAPGQNKKAKFLAQLADLEPNLVVNTGDNLGHLEAVNPALRALEPLAKFPGVFVNGSNDYRSPKAKNPLDYLKGPSVVRKARDLDTNRFSGELENFGWLNLNNQSGSLEIAGQRFGFLGLDDPHENLDDLARLSTQRSSLSDVDTWFGVAHAPYLRVIEAFANQGAELIFAGHTHGGQVCLPGQKALVSNCDLPPKFASGLSGWEFAGKTSMLHVSNGLGCSIYAPARLFCPPSATLLEIS